ncbi:hypothetical protein F2P45_33180 [Massilia sp. CCM 8733]|uniref:DUF559 domain-containing protein n=1 Tax=Massilia mucilaginosa TaxID=2609282 RepID=A0ABX0P393_9BURK|nr:hypothetical protein [Massilia mucilaginosa]NHZ93819.1 hypothetical protein [Massilia mucilaginosa]
MKKPYKLPKSLRGNARFDDLCRLLNSRYRSGVQAALRIGERRPGEARVIEMATQIFGVPFPKVRPVWLVDDDTGSRIELDGYNEQKRFAIEYQSGAHHHVCEKTLYREKLKRRTCNANGVVLLEIWPEIHTTRVLLQFFEVMGVMKIIPRCSTLWYGCWLNSIVRKELFSHAWLTYRSAGVANS